MLNLFVVFIISIVFTSCSATRHLEPHQKIIVKNKISISNNKIDSDDMMNYVRQKPNRKTVGFLFHLRVHNLFAKSERKLGTWIRETIGESPVIYDSLALQKTLQQFEIYMKERGYYSSVIDYSVKPKCNKQKIHVAYKIKTGEPYKIQSIQYEIPDTNLAEIIKDNASRSLLVKDNPFDIQTLLEERQRLTNSIHNHGYYSFSIRDLYYTADTTVGDLQVALTIGIVPNSKTSNQMYPQYKIRKTIIYPDFSADAYSDHDKKHVFDYDEFTTFVYQDSMYVKPEIIARANYIENNELYNYSRVQRTHRQLSRNNLFKIVTISFDEAPSLDSMYKYIDCSIQISRVTQQAFSVELEGRNTAGDWGAEANVSYMNKNILRGAENFQIRALANAEYNRSLKTDGEGFRLFNTYEYGVEMKLEIPKFLSPYKPAKFDRKYRPVTNFKIAYNYNKTTLFTRPISNFSYGYMWLGNNYLTHYLHPFDVSYIYYDATEEFQKFIASKDYYKYSYEDYVIYSSNYSFVFSNRNPSAFRNYHYLKFYVESSGNVLYLANKILNQTPNESFQYETFNVIFAQYVKAELDFRHYSLFTKRTSFVTRLFGGVAAPYLNSDWMPSVKKYYAGGANSMRGWSARTLGLGSHIDTISSMQYNLGDIKLEANFEFRFPMSRWLNGALFVDIGNIWAFRNNELVGAEFFMNSFFKEFAVAAGYGFRFDLSFFVFRVDLGTKIREPFPIQGSNSHFIWGNRNITRNDFNINIGIGYPF